MPSIFHLDGMPRNYFALQKKFLRFVGVSFMLNENYLYRVYSLTIRVLILPMYPILQLTDVFKFYNNLEILSELFIYNSLLLLGLAKSCMVYLNQSKLEKFIKRLEEGVMCPNSEYGEFEINCVKNCIVSTNKQCVFYFACVYIPMSFGVADCVYRRILSNNYHDWKFPFGSFSIFGITQSPNYELSLTCQVVCVTMCFTSLMITDLLIAGLLAHISTQCLLLRYRIQSMVKKARTLMLKHEINLRRENPQVSWKYLRSVLVETVEHHSEIIQFAQQLESQFSYLALVQFLSTSGTLCFSMYYLSTISMGRFEFYQYLWACIDIAAQVLFYCYWGNEVTLKSQSVVAACYECDFVGTDLRFQKGLLIMMKRCQNAIVFTAGRFTNLSLETYVWIIRASYSYFMVLRRL